MMSILRMTRIVRTPRIRRVKRMLVVSGAGRDGSGEWPGMAMVLMPTSGTRRAHARNPGQAGRSAENKLIWWGGCGKLAALRRFAKA